MTTNIFSYGSLMYPDVILALTNKIFHSEQAVLYGYERRLMKGKIYPGIITKPNAEIAGTLWCDLDNDSLKILDTFEDKEYERTMLEVETHSGTMNALAYTINVKQAQLLDNSEWDPNYFKTNHLKEYINMCCRFREEFLNCK